MPRLTPARLAGLLALALLAGCSKAESPGGAAGKGEEAGKKKYSIAVIPKGTTHEFWKSVHAGAIKAAMEAGDVEVIWKGPHREKDLSGQIQIVQDFVTSGVDGICLAPLHSQAMVRPTNEAIEQGVPVLIFDSALADESQIVSFVATDNRRGGALAADRLAEVLGGTGDVILLRYMVGSESTEQREEGFLDRLKEKHPDINVLVSNEYALDTPETALSKATQLLQKYRDEVDGIFAVCEPNCEGTLQALRNTDLAGKVKFVAFDPNEALIRGMTEGHVQGIVLQDPVTMGHQAVKVMHTKLTGGTVEKRVQTGEYMATPENMNSPEMKKLLNPERFEE